MMTNLPIMADLVLKQIGDQRPDEDAFYAAYAKPSAMWSFCKRCAAALRRAGRHARDWVASRRGDEAEMPKAARLSLMRMTTPGQHGA